MSALLLDTHVLVWLATDPQQIPERVRAELESADEVLVSAASAYEIAQKSRQGRLPHAELLLGRWDELIDGLSGSELALTVAHMRRAGELVWAHRDPFDRMLVAQAQLDGLHLVTKDQRIRANPDVFCVGWQ